MSEQLPEPPEANFPEVADDDYPERARYPEPREPMLPADSGYVGSDDFGTTPEEEREGESLDDRLEREVPEPGPEPLAPADADDRRDPDADDAPAGRLVEPDAGAGTDVEKDLVGGEGDAAADATAEEAAVRVQRNP